MKNILIIEDDIEIVTLVKKLLSGKNMNLFHTENAEDAMEILVEDPRKFDTILLDKALPGTDGIELIKKIKVHKANIISPIVMISGDGNDEKISEAIRAGAYYYLTKPLRKHSFITVINKSIEYLENQVQGKKFFNKLLNGNGFVQEVKASVQSHKDILDIAYSLSFFFERPSIAFRGIYELVRNAVEHGVYEVGSDKTTYLAEDDIGDYLDTFSVKNRKKVDVQILVKNLNGKTVIQIDDPGEGFEWSNFLTLDPANSNKLTGKGIAYASQVCFDEITYNKKGNSVTAVMNNSRLADSQM